MISFELQTLIDEQRMDYLCDVAPSRKPRKGFRWDNPDLHTPPYLQGESSDCDPTLPAWLEGFYLPNDCRLEKVSYP
jgi:hypothetical protein